MNKYLPKTKGQNEIMSYLNTMNLAQNSHFWKYSFLKRQLSLNSKAFLQEITQQFNGKQKMHKLSQIYEYQIN